MRGLKQTLYSLFYLAVIGLIIYGFYALVTEPATCFDGIQNQDELDVDCGGICGNICLFQLAPIDVRSQSLINIKEFDYDFVAQVRNSNLSHGGEKVSYNVDFINSAGGVVEAVRGDFFILPGETKFVFVSPVRLNSEATSAEFTITDTQWKELTDFKLQDIQLVVRRSDFTLTPDQTTFAEVDGNLFNDSDFDLDNVEVLVVLFDEGNNIIAAATTRLRTLVSGEDRFYRAIWFDPFEGEMSRIEVQPSTDVYENLNFLRQFGRSERFQQL